jgi:hypothetical protein
VTSRVRPAFLRRLARLSAREWRDLAEAQLELLIAKAVVATRPTGQLISRAPDEETHSQHEGPAAATDPRVEQLALAIGRAAEHGVFRPLCLVRAVALKRLLDRHGFTGSTVRFGVRIERGRFSAHAWVACGSAILGDQEWHVDSFTEFDGVTVVDHA